MPYLLEQLPRTLQAVTVDLQVWPESNQGARKHLLEMEWNLLAGQLHKCAQLQRVQVDIIWHKPKLSDYREFLPVVKESVVRGLTPLMKDGVSFEVRQPLSPIELF